MMFNQPICKFCNDRGCIACAGERKRRGMEEPNEPRPLFTADPNNPNDMELLKAVIGREAIEQRWEEVKRGDRLLMHGGSDIEEFVRQTNIVGILASMEQWERKEREERKSQADADTAISAPGS